MYKRPPRGQPKGSQRSAAKRDVVEAPSPSVPTTPLKRDPLRFVRSEGYASYRSNVNNDGVEANPQGEVRAARWALYSAPMPAAVNRGLHTNGLGIVVGAKPVSSTIR